MAPIGHSFSHFPQEIHLSLSIIIVCFSSSKERAPVGHTAIPLHSLALSQILKLINTASINLPFDKLYI